VLSLRLLLLERLAHRNVAAVSGSGQRKLSQNGRNSACGESSRERAQAGEKSAQRSTCMSGVEIHSWCLRLEERARRQFQATAGADPLGRRRPHQSSRGRGC